MLLRKSYTNSQSAFWSYLLFVVNCREKMKNFLGGNNWGHFVTRKKSRSSAGMKYDISIEPLKPREKSREGN